MHEGPPQISWFESLRRDAKLFAAVGFLALFLSAFQPLVVAAAASPAGQFVICTIYGVGEASDNSSGHASDVECPLCITGHSCAFQLAASTPAASPRIALPGAVETGGHCSWTVPDPGARAGDPPPSIRAPPLSV
ncbi:hypothetical protein [Nitratireductor pacificus]|uniref:DUF2946 domain-containing protein n=1 Tax=Nitratireductor pacificus pht-3B TaxID=391937 RepID=K2LSI7_9HYPH|nr:hypothetical protein [Nitratireductor pacificus]EKF20689.1 hypothetical protein NA2_02854 [Nitratireductor pacificus pht-3B]